MEGEDVVEEDVEGRAGDKATGTTLGSDVLLSLTAPEGSSCAAEKSELDGR